MQQQVIATVPAHSQGLSKWWPISFLLSAIVFFVIGGGLMGAWANSPLACYDDYDYCGYYDLYNGEFWGAIACFAIGGAFKITFWILLIVYCSRRNRIKHHREAVVEYVPQVPQNNTSSLTPSPGDAFALPQSPSSPQTVYSTIQNETSYPPTDAAIKFCGECGNPISTRFCPHCGTRA